MREVQSVRFACFAFSAALSLVTLGASSLIACSSDDANSGSNAHDSGPHADGEATTDAGPTDAGVDGAINGCAPADFVVNDHTAPNDPRVIAGPIEQTPAPYSPRCMRVKVGQTVTWTGDLSDHPIEFDFTESVPTDAAPTLTRGAPDGARTMDTVTFHSPGVLAFECTEHPTFMLGAVEVVE